jgi:hypothetical protein
MSSPKIITATPLQSFEHRMRDVKVDEAAEAVAFATLKPAHQRYVILFTPRSGSSWLTQLLSSTQRLGLPEEYINPDFVFDVARFLNAKTSGQLLDALLRRRKTENGIFGIEARAVDVDLIGFEAFQDRFRERTLYFHLWRDSPKSVRNQTPHHTYRLITIL